MGAVLAFTLASGVGVQAKSPEELAKVTQVSQAEFEALKPAGEATLEQKREVIGDILMDAGVPEFMADRIDANTVESLYNCQEIIVRSEYFAESVDGKLTQIPSEQKKRIDAYNDRYTGNAMDHVMLNSSGEISPMSYKESEEISNLTHGLIVGTAVDGRHICWAMGIWNASPLNRWVDFLGVTSSHTRVALDTATAAITYTVEKDGYTEEYGDTFEFDPDDFTESGCGVGKQFDMPNDHIRYNSSTQIVEILPCEDISMSLIVWCETDAKPESCYVVSDYYHKYIGLTVSVSFSGTTAGFSVSPGYAFMHSDVSCPLAE